jgi:hypothetical protein
MNHTKQMIKDMLKDVNPKPIKLTPENTVLALTMMAKVDPKLTKKLVEGMIAQALEGQK